METLWEVGFWWFSFQDHTAKHIFRLNVYPDLQFWFLLRALRWNGFKRMKGLCPYWLCEDAICSVDTLRCVPSHPRCQFSWFCPLILDTGTLDFWGIQIYKQKRKTCSSLGLISSNCTHSSLIMVADYSLKFWKNSIKLLKQIIMCVIIIHMYSTLQTVEPYHILWCYNHKLRWIVIS